MSMSRGVLSAGLVSALVVLGLFARPALAQRDRQLQGRLSEVEEELSLLRDVTGEASKTANQALLRLGELEKKVGDLPETIRKEVQALAGKVEAGQLLVTAQGERLDLLEKGIREMRDELEKRRLEVSGQLRLRPQYVSNARDFRSDLREDQDFFFSQRIRLGVSATPVRFMSATLQFQDVRTWGSGADLEEGSNAARVHQAFVTARIVEGLELRAGRQEWSFGSQRMISPDDWNQAGRSFDGIDLSWRFRNWIQADALFALLDERAASDGDDKVFGGIYLSTPILKPMLIDLYWLHLQDPRAGARRTFSTIGARVGGRLPWHEALLFDLEAAIQAGKVSEGDPDDQLSVTNPHLAAAYYAMLGYELPVLTRPTIKAFFLSASGDPNRSPLDPANDRHTAFLPLFPLKSSLLGRMEVFNLSNVWSTGAELGLTPWEGVHVEVLYSYFSLVEPFGDLPAEGLVTRNRIYPSRSPVGHELDLSASWEVDAHFALGAGYSVLLPAGAVEDQVRPQREATVDGETGTWIYPGGDPAHWAWLQADFRF
ncbi:MAG: alginate export family protein [Deltaproteobacteria bacterium]|nr:alginate export family protein [Deltaproteobacteria bacterium]